jgi:hypothetical protein
MWAGWGGAAQGNGPAASAGSAQGDGSLCTGTAGNPLPYPLRAPVDASRPPTVSASPVGAERRSAAVADALSSMCVIAVCGAGRTLWSRGGAG